MHFLYGVISQNSVNLVIKITPQSIKSTAIVRAGKCFEKRHLSFVIFCSKLIKFEKLHFYYNCANQSDNSFFEALKDIQYRLSELNFFLFILEVANIRCFILNKMF
jgi:hypothetical protein